MVKAEESINAKGHNLDRLSKCLATLKGNILSTQKMDSEKYLERCNKHFLRLFLTSIENDVKDINLQFEAEQSKVNWAKSHNESESTINGYRKNRDKLFAEVQKLISAREALKNVVQRPQSLRKKKKKPSVVSNCFHEVFLELVSRIEEEDKQLCNLVSIKVNIAGAREAAEVLIKELDNNNRDSSRTTRFEPSDLSGHNSDSGVSDHWLPIVERVARLISMPNSKASCVHKQGCQDLKRRMDVALSEYHLFAKGGHMLDEQSNSVSGADSRDSPKKVTLLEQSRSSITMHNLNELVPENIKNSSDSERNSPTSEDTMSCDLPPNCKRQISEDWLVLMGSSDSPTSSSSDEEVRSKITGPELKYSNSDLSSKHLNDDLGLRESPKHDDAVSKTLNSPLSSFAIDNPEDDSQLVSKRDRNIQRNRYHQDSSQQEAESYSNSLLMTHIESIKSHISAHFHEVCEALYGELELGASDQSQASTRKEMLWKTYDKFFCQVSRLFYFN